MSRHNKLMTCSKGTASKPFKNQLQLPLFHKAAVTQMYKVASV